MNLKLKNINNRKSQNGIALIALIIIIIILLILAGIIIVMLTGDNSILKNATEAKEATGITQIDETISNTGTVTSNREVVEAVSRKGLKVGDYIDYIPDPVETGYPPASLASSITDSYYNSSDITQENLNWRILRIYDDGSLDLVGDPTRQCLDFYGALGYNNGVYVMNDICEKLYSKGDIKARSINYEDIEYWLTDEGKAVRDSYTSNGSVKYGETKTYTSSSYRYYPDLYQYEKGAGINSASVGNGTLEISQTYGGYTNGITSNTYSQADANGLTVTQTYWNADMNSTNFGEAADTLYSDYWYWIASRYARCTSIFAEFGLREAGTYLLGDGMINSIGGGDVIDEACLRPVVSLGSETKITVCSGDNSADNPHTITQY